VFVDMELVVVMDGAWFTLCGNINSCNNRYWFCESPHTVHEVLCMMLNRHNLVCSECVKTHNNNDNIY